MKSILFFLPLAVLWSASGCQKKVQSGGGRPSMAVQAVVIEAKRQPVSESLSLVGSISANEIIEVKSEADGIVEEILFQEGQPVKKGELLVQLDERKFAAVVAEAEANFKLSSSTHERSKQLYEDKLISQQEFDQTSAQFQGHQAGLDLKRRQWQDSRIFARFDGVVGSRQVSPGQVISKDTTLTWLVDLDPMKVEVNVPERYLGQVAIGQTIEFMVAAFPTERFTGQVYFISPQLDAATRTVLVKARVPNPGHKLKGGMFANLALTLQLRESAIVIPEPALMSSGETVSVFVLDDQNNAQMRPVKIGLRLAGKAEVVSGLEPGERVVVEGTQKIFPGALVKPASPQAASPYVDVPVTEPRS